MRNLLLLCVALATPALAADHAEAPGAAADRAADIADYITWADSGSFVGIVTFAALTPAGGDAVYDADVLYTLHFDQDGDNVSDLDVHVRFGQDGAGAWGVQAMGLGAAVEGPVETLNVEGDVKLWAGLRDDPFFFDLQGYGDTLATATVSFDSSRDSLAGTNVTAIVIEAPVATVAGGSAPFTTWVTTARK